jgi:hypothetical protein
MVRRVSDYLRLCAAQVSGEGPRVAERNKSDVNGDPLDMSQGESAPTDPAEDEPVGNADGGPGAPMKPGTPEEAPRPTAGPSQRAPRRQPAHSREWNPDTRRQKMREYMQQYRGTGKINERKTQVRT